MRVVLASYGSTGDVVPLVALARGLRERGHEPLVVGDVGGAALASEFGLEYRLLPGVLSALFAPGGPIADAAKTGRLSLRSTAARWRDDQAWLRELMSAARGVDVMVGLPAAAYHTMVAAREVGARPVVANLQPLHATHEFVPSGLGVPSVPAVLNRPIGRLVEWAGWRMLARPINQALVKLGLPRVKRDPTRGVHVLGAWSPTLAPRPGDWSESRFSVTGAWHVGVDGGWVADPGLERFLADGEPPVYVGFGSMPTFSGSRRLQAAVIDALAGRRVIYAGAVVEDERLESSDTVHRLDGFVPHDWLLPRCAAVIHHCGAGTAHAAVRAGVPSVPVPFMLDQPFWADRLVRLGVASRPLDPRTATASELRAAIESAMSQAMTERAQILADRMMSEDGVAATIDLLEVL